MIESPLVDMLRYHELPPGASWMGEYGDPRIPAEAKFIAEYSGYQNLRERHEVSGGLHHHQHARRSRASAATPASSRRGCRRWAIRRSYL